MKWFLFNLKSVSNGLAVVFFQYVVAYEMNMKIFCQLGCIPVFCLIYDTNRSDYKIDIF